MTLECPHCHERILVSELRRVQGMGGGRLCPNCEGKVKFSQPFAAFRKSLALILIMTILLFVGLRSALLFITASLVLWPLALILVNMICVYTMPLGLKLWLPRTERKRRRETRHNHFKDPPAYSNLLGTDFFDEVLRS
jgi:hypothetical protein